MHQVDAQTRNSPYMTEITMAKSIRHWRKVSIDGGNVYVSWNAPVEAPGRTLVFGEAESRVKVIVPRFEADGAGDSNGNRDSDDRDGDGTVSSGNINSMRVDGVQLAGEASQHERPNAEMKMNIPVSPRPPI